MDEADSEKLDAVLQLLVAEVVANISRVQDVANDAERLELAALLSDTNNKLWQMRSRFMSYLIERASHPSEGDEEQPS